MKIHHIGYLVNNIDSAVLSFEKLGFDLVSPITEDKMRNVLICFLENNGYRVELVSPVGRDSDVYNLMKKKKNSPYHLCYEVNDIERSLEEYCAANESLIIQPPKPAIAIENRKVAFVMHKDLGIIEFVETP